MEFFFWKARVRVKWTKLFYCVEKCWSASNQNELNWWICFRPIENSVVHFFLILGEGCVKNEPNWICYMEKMNGWFAPPPGIKINWTVEFVTAPWKIQWFSSFLFLGGLPNWICHVEKMNGWFAPPPWNQNKLNCWICYRPMENSKVEFYLIQGGRGGGVGEPHCWIYWSNEKNGWFPPLPLLLNLLGGRQTSVAQWVFRAQL